MKFSRGHGKIILLFSFIILSIILSYLLFEFNISLAKSYLISAGIMISLYVIISFINYFIIKRYRKINGIITSKTTSILIGNNINFKIEFDDKSEIVTCYQTLTNGNIKEKENIYISKSNVLYREKTIMIYPPTIMILILIIGIGLIFLGLNIDDILFSLKLTYSTSNINKSLNNIIIFKLCNFVLIGAITLFNKAIKESIKGRNKVEAIIIKKEEVEVTEELPGKIEYHDYKVDRLVYRYVWKGEIKTFVPLINNAVAKKIGTTVKLNVDDNGEVIRENIDLVFLYLWSFMLLLIYMVGILAFFMKIFYLEG